MTDPGFTVATRTDGAAPTARPSGGSVLLDLVVRHRGNVAARFTTAADPRNAAELQQILIDTVRRRGGADDLLTDYEMDVHRAARPSR